MQVFVPKKAATETSFYGLCLFLCVCFPLKLPHFLPPWTPTASTSTSERACRQEWFDVSSKVATSGKIIFFVGRGCFVYRRAYDLSLLRKDAIDVKWVSPCEAFFKRHIWWWMTYFWCHSNSFVGEFLSKWEWLANKVMFTHHQDHDGHQSLWCEEDVVPPDTMTVSVGYPIEYWQANLACWKMNLLQMLVS